MLLIEVSNNLITDVQKEIDFNNIKYMTSKEKWLKIHSGDFGSFKEESLSNFLKNNSYWYIDNKTSNESEIITLLRTIGYSNIFNIIKYVLDKNPDWWNYKKNWSSTQETEMIFKDLFTNKPNKCKDTTIASIYIAYSGLTKNIENIIILKILHNVWCNINSVFENYENLNNKRINQYKKFEFLSEEDKNKDIIWINAIKEFKNL